VFHPSKTADVKACKLGRRYDVTPVLGASRQAAAAPSNDTTTRAWLLQMPDDGARLIFEHLAQHGILTEDDAMTLLGSARALRRFAARFDELVLLAPFTVRIQSVSGIKRYVREGNES